MEIPFYHFCQSFHNNQKFNKSKKAVAGKRIKRDAEVGEMQRVVICRMKIRKGDAEDIQKINRKPR